MGIMDQEALRTHLSSRIFKAITAAADEDNKETYVIGGYVRDIFLKRPSKDIDVVVVGSGIDLAKKTAAKIGQNVRVNIFKNFGTAQIKLGETEVEFVGARKESYERNSRKPIVEDGTLEDDQNRRDFTINALALCLNGDRYGELLDPFNGFQHLQEKLLKTPLDPDITFSDDPLRMMRAIRFATQLDFRIDDETLEAITRNRERIHIISKERVIDELNKIILSPKPSIGFKLLSTTELLPIIFPELDAMKGIDEVNGQRHKDNFYHTLQVLDNLATTSDNLWLRWSAILHDIAKPRTKRFEEGAGWTFHNHNFIGEKMVPGIFKRMKLPLNEKMRFVQKMVSLHMRPIVLSEEVVTDSAIRRLLSEAGDDIDLLMQLCEADITSKNKEKVKRYLTNFKVVRSKLIDIEEKDRIRQFQPPIAGDEIMAYFNLTPCQAIGDIKKAIKEAILDGEIPNEYDAAKQYMITIAKEMGITADSN